MDQALTRRDSRARRRLGILAVIGLLVVAWLVVGRWSAEGVARNYFAAVHHGASASVTADAISPAIPPFYAVKVSGFVHPPDMYDGNWYSMTVWVEPLTGVVFLISWD
jgi:hypothetical protein